MMERGQSNKPPMYVFVSNGSAMCWRSPPANDDGGAERMKVPRQEMSNILDDPAMSTYGFRGPALGYRYPPPPSVIRAPLPPPPSDRHQACGFRAPPTGQESENVLKDDDLLRRYGYTTNLSGAWGYDLSGDPTKA